MNDRIDASLSSHLEGSLAIFDDLTAIGNIDRDEWLEIVTRSFTAGVNAAQDDAIIERQIAMDAERLRQSTGHVLPWPESGAIIDRIRETVKTAQGEVGA
jgi:hypothetical protein